MECIKSINSFVKQKSLNSNNIPSLLHTIRNSVNKDFFQSLDSQGICELYDFLWISLDFLWKNGTPQIRISSSTTMGHIITRLSPFFSHNLIESLRKEISRRTSESILLLLAFCHLSKFSKIAEIKNMISQTPIFHLFGNEDSELIVPLINEFSHLPSEFLLNLAEYFFQLSLQNPSNRHFPRAASRLLSIQPSMFDSLIKRDTALSLISIMFPDKMPILSPSNLSLLIQRAFEFINNKNSKPTDVEYSSLVIASLIKSGQISHERFQELFNPEVISCTSFLPSILTLPLKSEWILPLFKYNADDQTILPAETNIISHLMNHFAKYSHFLPELVTLVSKNLRNDSELLSLCLTVIPEIQNKVDNITFCSLLSKAFKIETQTWIQDFWLLKILKHIDISLLPEETTILAQDLVQKSIFSSSDKLRKVAKDATLSMSNSENSEIFFDFLDRITRMLDSFDENSFQLLLDYLAYILSNIHPNQVLCYVHLGQLFDEIMIVFRVSLNILRNILTILALLPSEILKQSANRFIKIAVSVIVSSWEDFTGEKFHHFVPPTFQCEKIADVLINGDCDIAANPGLSHNTILSCCESAIRYLCKFNYEDINLCQNEVHFLFLLASEVLCFFPTISNDLGSILLQYTGIPVRTIIDFTQRSLSLSYDSKSCFSLVKFINISFGKYHIQVPNIAMKDFAKEMKDLLISSQKVDYSIIISVIKFLHFHEIEFDESIIPSIIKPDQLHLFTRSPGPAAISVQQNNPKKSVFSFDDLCKDKREQIPTISTFVFLQKSIPFDLLSESSLISLLLFFPRAIEETYIKQILDYSHIVKSPRLVDTLLKYCLHYKIILDFESDLKNDYMKDPGLILSILSIWKLKNKRIEQLGQAEKDYIHHCFGNNLCEYVLFALDEQIEYSINLIRLDPIYFIGEFLNCSRFKSRNLRNFCIFFQKVPFPTEPLFLFLHKLFTRVKGHQKKRSIAIRLLTCIIKRYSRRNQIVLDQAIQLIQKEFKDINSLDSVSILELGICFSIISEFKMIKINHTLASMIGQTNPYGILLKIRNNGLMIEDILSNAFSCYPSVQMIPYQALSAELENSDTINEEKLTVILSYYINSSSILNYTILNLLKTICSKKISRVTIGTLSQYLFRQFKPDTSHPSINSIIEILMVFSKRLSKNSNTYQLLGSLIEDLLNHPYLPPNSLELAKAWGHRLKRDNFIQNMILKHIKENLSYEMPYICCFYVQYMVQTMEKSSIPTIIPFSKQFFNTFLSIAWLKKTYPEDNFDIIKSDFQGSHRKSLEYLQDSRRKPFSAIISFYTDSNFGIQQLIDQIDNYIQ